MFTSVCDVSRPPLAPEFKDPGFTYAAEWPTSAGTHGSVSLTRNDGRTPDEGIRILKFMDDSATAVTNRRKKKKIIISRSQEKALGSTS